MISWFLIYSLHGSLSLVVLMQCIITIVDDVFVMCGVMDEDKGWKWTDSSNCKRTDRASFFWLLFSKPPEC